MTTRSLLTLLLAAAVAASAHAQPTFAQDTKLTIMVFRGMQNLPILTAQSKGYFAKRRIALDVKLAPNSDEMRNGLAAGRYQLVHSGIDNSVHLVEHQKVDSIIFMGGDHGFNYLLVQPQISTYADIRGKTVGVDSVDTAYAFLLYAMLKRQGLERADYTPKSIGSSTLRLEALKSDKSIVASMLNPPFSLIAMRDAGMKNWGWAVDTLGPYQATGGYVLRAWAAANSDVIERYIQAYVEGLRYAVAPQNRTETLALLIDNLKLAPDIAAQSYDMLAHPTRGLAKDAKFDLDGFRNVLKLRVEAQGGTVGTPEKYFDLKYYDSALKRM